MVIGIILVVIALGCFSAAASNGEPVYALIGIGIIGLIIYCVAKASGDTFNVQSGKDLETLAKKRLEIKGQYGYPKIGDSNYEACEKALYELDSTVQYGSSGGAGWGGSSNTYVPHDPNAELLAEHKKQVSKLTSENYMICNHYVKFNGKDKCVRFNRVGCDCTMPDGFIDPGKKRSKYERERTCMVHTVWDWARKKYNI